MDLVRLFGTSAALIGLALAACNGDDGTSSSQSATTTTTTSGAGGGGGSCEGDLTGQAGGALICMGQASDTECVGCTRMNCCTELQACLPDEKCRCLLECFISGCDPVGCLAECGTGMPTEGLISCVTPNCEICTQPM